eukprot:scaffold597_cov242-Prasinococcus_capsulatus_cf.AAC.7
MRACQGSCWRADTTMIVWARELRGEETKYAAGVSKTQHQQRAVKHNHGPVALVHVLGDDWAYKPLRFQVETIQIGKQLLCACKASSGESMPACRSM